MTEAHRLAQELMVWQNPAAMVERTARLSEVLGNRAMYREGRAFREGFIAGRFAIRREATAVRLLPEDSGGVTPDFELRLPEGDLRFETTEADIPGRKRTDEYRQPPKTEPISLTRLDIIVEEMRRLAAKKAAKNYADCQGLVIWVNPPAFSFTPNLRWKALLDGAEPAASTFREVWAMRGSGALLWLDGQAQPEPNGIEF